MRKIIKNLLVLTLIATLTSSLCYISDSSNPNLEMGTYSNRSKVSNTSTD